MDISHLKPLSALHIWADNYNKGDVDAISLSIRRFGFNNAPRLWLNNEVRGGNHTTLAIQKIKAEGPKPTLDKSYPPQNVIERDGEWFISYVDISHLDPLEANAFAIADNELARKAVRDDDLLFKYLTDIKVDPVLFEATGFDLDTYEQLKALAGETVTPPTEADVPSAQIDRAEELMVKWGVERGQLWIIPSNTTAGEHRILCGDCTNPNDVERVLLGETATITFTSPPYNMGESALLNGDHDSKYVGGSEDNLDDGTYFSLLSTFTRLALTHSRYVFVNLQQLAGNKITLIDYLHTFKTHFADVAVWCKTNVAPAMARNVMNSAFEYIYIFAQDEYPKRTMNSGDFWGTVSNVYTGGGNSGNEFADVHGAAFPVHLPSWGIDNFTQIGDTVFDPFLGLGTTILACEHLHRLGRGIELEPKYVAVCLERLSQMGLVPELA